MAEPKEEEYDFEVPDFDEDAFIHRELTSFRTTTVLFLWAIIVALLSWLGYSALGAGKSNWYLALIFAGICGYLLKFIFPLVRADVRHFQRKDWFGTGFLYFFSWLAIFILLVNPPVSDFADPQVMVYVPEAAPAGVLEVHVVFEDNSGIANSTFTLMRGSTVLATMEDLEDRGGGVFLLSYDFEPGEYSIAATVEDDGGRTASWSGPLDVSDVTRLIIYNADAITLESNSQRVTVETRGLDYCTVDHFMSGKVCVRSVFIDANNGERVVMAYDAVLKIWSANRDTAGWNEGSNEFDIVVDTLDSFHGSMRLDGVSFRLTSDDIAASGKPYPIVVPEPGDSNISRGLELPNPDAPVRTTPGVGLAFLVLGLLALAARRR